MRGAVLWLALVGCTREAPPVDEVDTEVPEPPVDPEAAARAFQPFYRERVERVLVAWNRFGLFGDASAAASIARVDIARSGNDWEVIPGPKDNNPIGASTYAAWAAWKVHGGERAELTLVRMLQGLVFLEQVSGVPGLTVRQALPGWTRTMDAATGEVVRERNGEPVMAGVAPAVNIDADVLRAFHADARITYREDPGEFFFTHHPVADLNQYVVTYAFPEPEYLRVSDCCSSFLHTPPDRAWSGAWWGNHNSRDNTPDLLLGYATARLVLADPMASERLRLAARAAAEAGQRVGDLIVSSGSNVMTVDEFSAYGELTVSGALRPHGLSEGSDLGSLGACPVVWLAQAVSTAGLSLPVTPLPLPGDIEDLLRAIGADCPAVEPRLCTTLGDAFCGTEWTTVENIQIFGQPWLELAAGTEAAVPGSSERLFGAFQSDLIDVVEALANVAVAARAAGDAGLEAEVQAQIRGMTNLIRGFADIVWAAQPERRAEQRYAAAVLDAIAGVAPIAADLAGLPGEVARQEAWEGLLTRPDTAPWELLSDESLAARIDAAVEGIEDHPSGRDDVIRARYEAEFGDERPVRRAGEAYEARRAGGDWVPVPNPRHVQFSNTDLLVALPLCVTRPDAVDCRWARRGCAAADLDGSGVVDEADTLRFAEGYEEGLVCTDGCGGVDVDGDGTLSSLDERFLEAAMGCFTAVPPSVDVVGG